MRSALGLGIVVLAGCVNTELPPPPGPPQPGSLSGRVVAAQPGRSDRVPVIGAEIVLLGSGVSTTSDGTGAFLLSGITRASGKVLLRADSDGNGSFDKQRLLSLEALKAGPGRAISLGDVLISDNARLEGKVLRGDVMGARGHAGSLAFLPEGPFSALTADDGTFVFNELPEGVASVSFFRAGYRAREFGDVQLTPGQTLTLREVTLLPLDASERKAVTLSGRVVPFPTADTTGASVEVNDGVSAARVVNASATGEFSFSLMPGLYSLTVRLAGYRTAVLSNVVVQGADRDLGSIVLVSGTGTVGGTGGGAAGGGAAGGSAAGGSAAGGSAAGGSAAGGGAAGGSAAGGSAAGGSAAGGSAAGGSAAGGSAAGGSAAGGSAAGGNAAGGSAAGGSTAGGSAAGGSAAGGSAAGGSAAGGSAAPVAILDTRSFVRAGVTARLDGRRSVDTADAGPLSFRWTELSDAGVTLNANDSVLASAPTFLAPTTPRVLSFELVVTNQLGAVSAPASTIVEVLQAPVARVVPTSLVMRTGSTSSLSAATSTDPAGAPLTFTWSVVAGNVSLSSMGGATVTVTAPSLPEAAQLRLVVSNAGVSADPLLIPIVVSATATPTATVSVGAPQVVGLGDSVTITAVATSTNSAEGFGFSWSQTSGPALVLAGTMSPVLGFTAPVAPGRFTFTVTATGDAGALGMAVATVDVEDDDAPVLVTSDPLDAPGASGGWYSLTATFDEPLAPASVNALTISLRAGSTPVPVDLRLENAAHTVRITPHTPLTPGAAYTLDLGALTDASPRRNPFVGRALPFNARQPNFTRWSYTTGTNLGTRAFPALAVSSTQVWVVSRDWSGTYVIPYAFEPNFVDGGVMQPRIQLPGTNFIPVTARRGLVVNDVPHMLYPGSSPTLVRTGPSTWANIAGGGEVTIATDGVRLVGLSENYGPRWLTFTSPATAPLVEQIENYVGSMPPWGGLNPAGQEGAFANAVSGTNQFVVIPTTTRLLRAYLRQGAGAWTNLTTSSPLPAEAREVRATFNGTSPVLCYVHIPTSGRQLSCSAWNGMQWNHSSDLGPGTVEALDLFTRGGASWLTFAGGGNISVKWLRTNTGGLVASTLNGPTGVETWSTPGCNGTNPESFATAQALHVLWEENCGGFNILRLQKVE